MLQFSVKYLFKGFSKLKSNAMYDNFSLWIHKKIFSYLKGCLKSYYNLIFIILPLLYLISGYNCNKNGNLKTNLSIS